MAEPTVLEWVVTSLAVLAVVAVGAAVIVLPAWAGAATNACRVTALGLGALSVAALLAAGVLASAGSLAATIDLAADVVERPTGTFVVFLVDADPDATEAVGTYAPLVLGPLAALLGVLAHAVADPARTVGLRAVVGLVLSALLVGAVLVVRGDTGPLAATAAVGIAAVAAVSGTALALDEWHLRAGKAPDGPPEASGA